MKQFIYYLLIDSKLVFIPGPICQEPKTPDFAAPQTVDLNSKDYGNKHSSW